VCLETNSNEETMLPAMEALNSLIVNRKNNEIVCEMLVKLRGVALLTRCAKDYDISAKLEALTIVASLQKIEILSDSMKREIL
jgi:hypothetical protein